MTDTKTPTPIEAWRAVWDDVWLMYHIDHLADGGWLSEWALRRVLRRHWLHGGVL